MPNSKNFQQKFIKNSILIIYDQPKKHLFHKSLLKCCEWRFFSQLRSQNELGRMLLTFFLFIRIEFVRRVKDETQLFLCYCIQNNNLHIHFDVIVSVRVRVRRIVIGCFENDNRWISRMHFNGEK